jgi:tetratricopeptide (TPR) repeat protein
MLNHIKRCYFEAQQGWVSRALERVQDIADEFPREATVFHAEATLCKDYLGRGLAARDLCEKAYQLEPTEMHANNAAMLARNEEEFSKWTELALKAAPHDLAILKFKSEGERLLKTGVPYWHLLAAGSERCRAAKEFGMAASLLEVALFSGGMRPEEELNLRSVRAECLRALDSAVSRQRETRMEAFQPEERLTLREALAEVERGLVVNEYESELWNLKSAWCTLLERHEEAIKCADRALELRPHRYPKPFINKARALRSLKRGEEALKCAREALKQAEGGEPKDIALAREMIDLYSTPQSPPTLGDCAPLIKHLLKSAWLTADQELGQQGDSIQRLAKGFWIRAHNVRSDRSMDYVLLMSEVLSDFTPEVVLCLTAKALASAERVSEHCLYAILYVAAHSEGVRQRDAARFIALSILAATEEQAIRASYREAILETAAAADDEMARLDETVREELRYINPLLPGLIATQAPVDEGRRKLVAATLRARFTGAPAKPASDSSPAGMAGARRGSGCAAVLAALLFLALVAYTLF